jgi:hypothetical protein
MSDEFVRFDEINTPELFDLIEPVEVTLSTVKVLFPGLKATNIAEQVVVVLSIIEEAEQFINCIDEFAKVAPINIPIDPLDCDV